MGLLVCSPCSQARSYSHSGRNEKKTKRKNDRPPPQVDRQVKITDTSLNITTLLQQSQVAARALTHTPSSVGQQLRSRKIIHLNQRTHTTPQTSWLCLRFVCSLWRSLPRAQQKHRPFIHSCFMRLAHLHASYVCRSLWLSMHWCCSVVLLNHNRE